MKYEPIHLGRTRNKLVIHSCLLIAVTLLISGMSKCFSQEAKRDSSNSKITASLKHKDKITAVIFAPDGKTLLTASVDKTACLWNSTTGIPIGKPLLHGGI